MRRVPVAAAIQTKSSAKTFPAPIRGWVLNEGLASSKPGGARMMENWRPTSTGIQLRGGSLRYATLGSFDVQSLFAFDAAGVKKFFGSGPSDIFDITTVVDPAIPPVAAISGLSNGHFSHALMTTEGGSYMLCVNGADTLKLFDGGAWSSVTDVSSPDAITGVATSLFSDVWVYRKRLFFVEAETLNAWYLPADSIGGEAHKFSLAGIFQEGGSLLFGARWSLDAGDGIDDKCVFVSDRGEAAIYEGSDPGDADNWNEVGLYQIGRPLGKTAKISAGGDLLIATDDGTVALSQAINKDRAALSLASITRTISDVWVKQAAERTLPWDMVKWPLKKILVVAPPAAPGQDQICLVSNLDTGAWAKYTGWDTRCLGLYGDQLYFGTSDGRVMQAESGGSDDGLPYVCTAVGAFEMFGMGATEKTIQMARATFTASKPFTPQVSASADYEINLPAAPLPADDPTNYGLWDIGLWDVAVWDSDAAQSVSTQWGSIGVTGFAVAYQVQVTCGDVVTPDAELVSIDMTYTLGGLVV